MASIVGLFLVMCLSVSGGDASSAPSSAFTVFGYLPEYRLSGFNYEAAFQTGLTHLIFFSIEISADGLPAALDRLPSKAQAAEARAAADKVGGKLLISFGGNSRSQNYAFMTAKAVRRVKFLEALEAILVEYGFDGVDYNWEYPANEAEWASWKSLLKESKERLLRGQSVPVVTFTIYVDPMHYRHITQKRIIDEADYVLAMAYDQHGEHSTMSFYQSSIDLAREHKVPLSKFVPGLPFYARHVRNGEPKTHQELINMKVPFKGSYVGQYYWNPPDVLEQKTRMARAAGLAGVMIWELGQDIQPLTDDRSLMRGLQRGLSSENNEL